jgi:hypothetical protein
MRDGAISALDNPAKRGAILEMFADWDQRSKELFHENVEEPLDPQEEESTVKPSEGTSIQAEE